MGAKIVFSHGDSGSIYRFHCPGCDCSHFLRIGGTYGWTWNGDEQKPTVNPSILTNSRNEDGILGPRCHSFIREGKIQFLNDCAHGLAGKTVELPDAD
jgi:hypothetical protein